MLGATDPPPTLPPTLPPFENLKAHAAVVVWAFPEAGAVIGGVRGAVGAEAPVPLAVGTDDVWRMKDHSASADSSQFDSPVFWYWLMQPTTVSAWTHQWRPESRRLVLLDRPELPWRT